MVDGSPLSKPVGVEPCAAPDMANLAAEADTADDWSAETTAEVAAAKQRWIAVEVPASASANTR